MLTHPTIVRSGSRIVSFAPVWVASSPLECKALFIELKYPYFEGFGEGFACVGLPAVGAIGEICRFKMTAPSGTSELAAKRVAEFLKYGRLKDAMAAAYCRAVAVPLSEDSVLTLNPPAITRLSIVKDAGRC
jgi:hypothetical protein